jgi:hypothetical protein
MNQDLISMIAHERMLIAKHEAKLAELEAMVDSAIAESPSDLDISMEAK